MIIKPFGEKGIPMLQGNIKDVSIIKENICALLKKQIDTGDSLEKTQEATVQNGLLLTIPNNVCKESGLLDLIKKITDEYYQNIPIGVGINKVVEDNIWVGLMKEGDFHMLHSHQKPGVVYDKSEFEGVSGGLYLKIPEKKPPQGNINYVLDDKVFSWSPKDGDYFVWPSYVIHGVYPFKGPGSRIMVSWNSI